MKRTRGPSGPGTSIDSAARKTPSTFAPPGAQAGTGVQKRLDVVSRIKLALLDEYTCENRGYDPYDTCGNRATADLWVSKRKRA